MRFSKRSFVNDFVQSRLINNANILPLVKCYSFRSLYRLMNTRQPFFHLLSPFICVAFIPKHSRCFSSHYLMNYCSFGTDEMSMSKRKHAENSLKINSKKPKIIVEEEKPSADYKEKMEVIIDQNKSEQPASFDMQKWQTMELKLLGYSRERKFPGLLLLNELYDSSSSSSFCTSSNDSETSVNWQELSEKIESALQQFRNWQFTEFSQSRQKTSRNGLEFTVMSYNILAQYLLDSNKYLYSHCRDYILNWEYRKKNLLKEILGASPDIICLQEIEEQNFLDTFRPTFQNQGYECLFKKKTGNKEDGCAIMFKKTLFILESFEEVEFLRHGSDILNRDNVGLIVLLKPRHKNSSNTKLCVATTHLIFNPKRGDVKLAQLRLLLAEIDKLAFRGYSKTKLRPLYHPVILCGDMNSQPYSPLYNFLISGKLICENIHCGDISGQEEGHGKGRGKILPYGKLVDSDLGITKSSQYLDVESERLNEMLFQNSTVTQSSKEFTIGKQVNKKELSPKQNECLILSEESSGSCITLSDDSRVSDSTMNSNITDNHLNNSEVPTTSIPNSSTIKNPFENKIMPSVLNTLQHHLNLVSVYSHIKPLCGDSELTTKHAKAACTVDYIFYSVKYKRNSKKNGRYVCTYKNEHPLYLCGYYNLTTSSEVDEIGGLPNAHLSSDHLSLMARFFLKLT